MAEIRRERSIHVLWCDDIRREVGNKPSFMGVYTGALLMPTIPSVLTRLAAYVSLTTPVERPFRKLVITVRSGAQSKGDEPIARLDFPTGDLASVPESPPGEDPSKMFVCIDAALLLGPIAVTDQTKWLKVFVETEDETVESFKLHMLRAPAQQRASATEAP